MTKKIYDLNDRLELLALLVSVSLRDEHGRKRAPMPTDYSIFREERASGAESKVRVMVDLGRGVAIGVDQPWDVNDDRDPRELVESSREIAATIGDVQCRSDEIRAMLSEVRSATRREIAKAGRRGLAYVLTSVTIAPIEAGTDDEPYVRVEHVALGRSLMPEPFWFEAAYADDVVVAFAGIADEQSLRASRRADLDRLGATGTVDSVLVAALEDAGVEPGAVFRRLRNADERVVEVERPKGGSIILYWEDGAIHSRLTLGEGARWNGNHLVVACSPKSMKKVAAGTPLSRIYAHPLLDGRLTVQWAHGSRGGDATIFCDGGLLLFDADSGRIWPA